MSFDFHSFRSSSVFRGHARRPTCVSQAAALVVAALLAPAAHAAIITVNTRVDVVDPVDGRCSLREAITASDANTASGAAAGECVAGAASPTVDRIDFAVSGVFSMSVALGQLPTLTDGALVIDGWSAPGWSFLPVVILNGGALTGTESGLNIESADNVVRGLAIGNFPNAGIRIHGSAAEGNWIHGNAIGTSADSTVARPNTYGVYVLSAGGNLIGTDGNGFNDGLERNVLSGNDAFGVYLNGASASGLGNVVAGNSIGTNWNGMNPMSNSTGIEVDSGASNNIIGTDGSGDPYDTNERNIISANIGYGARLMSGVDTIIAGNYIGTNRDGLGALCNGGDGIYTSSSSSGTRIGTNADTVGDAAETNIISGNLGNGIRLSGSDETVAGNLIGLDVTGQAPLGNEELGIYASYNAFTGPTGGPYTIGGTTAVSRNFISGNIGAGVSVNALSSVIQCNYVGTDITGSLSLPNGGTGIYAPDSPGLVIDDNRVSHHDTGVYIQDGPTSLTGNWISGNTVGFEYTAIGATFDAFDNWWGDASGPTHAGNPGGIGDEIVVTDSSSTVNYSPFLASAPVLCP